MFYNLGTWLHLHGSKTYAAYFTDFFIAYQMSNAPVFGNYRYYFEKKKKKKKKKTSAISKIVVHEVFTHTLWLPANSLAAKLS